MRKREREDPNEVHLVEPERLSQEEIVETCHLIEALLGPAGPADLCYDAFLRRDLCEVHARLVEAYRGRVLN